MPFFLAMVRLVLGLGLGLGLGLRRRPGVIKVRVGMPLFPYMIVRQWIGNGISGDRWGAAARAHQKDQLPRAARARPEVEAPETSRDMAGALPRRALKPCRSASHSGP